MPPTLTSSERTRISSIPIDTDGDKLTPTDPLIGTV